MAIDPVVARSVARATPPQRRLLLPLLKMLLFHLYYVPTSLLFLPINIIRSLIPFLRLDPRWSFGQNLAILYVRRVIRMFIRFKMQPIQPRENGWRESSSFIGTLLAISNMSGPGGKVIHPRKMIHAAEKDTDSGRLDRVWIRPPPLNAFRGLLTIRTSERGQKVENGETYRGPALVDPGMAKLRTKCYWFMHRDQLSPPGPGGRGSSAPTADRPVILYFHGGAGVTFSAGDLFMGETLAANLAKTSGIDVFSVEYILAPESKFPGSLVQALAAWFYLTRELGYHPSQIILGGDSYGGELALAFSRYLRTDFKGYRDDPKEEEDDSYYRAAIENTKKEKKQDLEKGQRSSPSRWNRSSFTSRAQEEERPAALLLLSPYCDARSDASNPPPCFPVNSKKDIIALPYGTWGHEARGLFELGKEEINPLTKEDPWFTSVNLSNQELQALPPIFIANGGAELLIDMGNEFVAKVKNVGGPQAKWLRHHVVDYAVHDYWSLPVFLKEARQSYRDFGKWWKEVEKEQKKSGGSEKKQGPHL